MIISVNNIVKEVKAIGYGHFSDERSIIRPIENFVIIFYSKYADVTHQFEFFIRSDEDNCYLVARNVSDFEYKFPLSKL
jgi:hypothetical protein